MINIRLSQLFTKEGFKFQGNGEKLIFTHEKYLKPFIIVDKKEYKTIRPIKQIIIIFNYILQSTELELCADDGNILLHINLTGSGLEDTILCYDTIQ